MKKMFKKIVMVCLLLLMAIGTLQAAQGFYVRNGSLYERNGSEFIMRGINHAHTWYTDRTSAFADMKDAGANCVRVVLSNGVRWNMNNASNVTRVIDLCKNNDMIAVLEVHDTTGYGEQSGACTLNQAVDYWIQIQSALTGQEDYVIINIGNEPWGNNNTGSWLSATTGAISRMRNAGFDHTLIVDAPNWGQDWESIMANNASQIYNSDPDDNTILAVHMYQVYDTSSKVQSYLSNFANNNRALIVGEFGADHQGENVAEAAILQYCQQYGIGYIGWSWCGNSSDVASLDIVNNWNAGSLSSWGNTLINSTNGLKNTSVEATIFNGNTPPPTTPPPATPSPGIPGDVNGDGEASIIDALMVAQYYVNLNPPNFNEDNADVDCNGAINILDALRIARYYVRLESSLGC